MNDNTEPLAVPHEELSVAALRGLAEAFVLREGTDYGERAYTLEEKISHVLSQLERGEAKIVFDPTAASVDIVLTRDAPRE